MRVAVFVSSFPLVSETFIVRQIAGLLDLGHEVDIYADTRPPKGAPIHPEVLRYGLLRRTRYMDMPPASGYWEMPICPLTGRTWLPGAETSIPNAIRLARAIPDFVRGIRCSPRLAVRVLRPSRYGYQARSLSALYRLARLCPQRRRRYDVLHAHFGPVGNGFRFARELLRAPMVVSFHGYDFSTWPGKMGRSVYKDLFDTVDAVTANSSHTAQKLRVLGCPEGKLHILPMGVDLRDFTFRERALRADEGRKTKDEGVGAGERVRLLTVGRLVEKKGVEYSIRAVAQSRDKHPYVTYHIVGDGPLRGQLEDLVEQLKLRDTVVFHGARDSSYVRRLMLQAHIFVLSSVTASDGDQEGQGLVLQEAQACGLPVLATEHNGFAESIAPGQSGFLVPERDVDALAQRLDFLLEHPDLWPQMGRTGRKLVEDRYDSSKLSLQLVSLYEQAIEQFRL